MDPFVGSGFSQLTFSLTYLQRLRRFVSGFAFVFPFFILNQSRGSFCSCALRGSSGSPNWRHCGLRGRGFSTFVYKIEKQLIFWPRELNNERPKRRYLSWVSFLPWSLGGESWLDEGSGTDSLVLLFPFWDFSVGILLFTSPGEMASIGLKARFLFLRPPCSKFRGHSWRIGQVV